MVKTFVDKERGIVTSLMANDTINIQDGTNKVKVPVIYFLLEFMPSESQSI